MGAEIGQTRLVKITLGAAACHGNRPRTKPNQPGGVDRRWNVRHPMRAQSRSTDAVHGKERQRDVSALR